MPVFDTPITTDDQGIEKILAQRQNKVIVLYDDKVDKPLDDALSKIAKKYAGDVLTVRINGAQNPTARSKFGTPGLPAIVTIMKNNKVKSKAEHARPADLRAHVDHLLNDTPLPEPKVEASRNGGKGGTVVNVSDKTFTREVLQSSIPVFVDFWAPWCGPCRMIAPHVEQLAKEYGGKVKFVKLNTDDNRRTSEQFQIRSIPTFMIFRDGKALNRMSGADPGGIRRLVDQALR